MTFLRSSSDKSAPARADLSLVLPVLPILLAGLVTMKSFVPGTGGVDFFTRQIVWILISLIVFFICSRVDFRFLRRTSILLGVFFFVCALLLLLLVFGETVRGVKSWFSFGFVSFQPGDFAKLALILILSKYFSRRHIEIKNIKHLFISGFYALLPFLLILLQPDFGTALVVLVIWFGMVLASGISKKHLLAVAVLGVVALAALWFFVFAPYQRERLISFLDPTRDSQNSGYNALQSVIAVGSGQVLGKGLGFGTQSRLSFLPEPQSDFIFAAFAEEWGLLGAVTLLSFFALLLWRILSVASLSASNFEALFAVGLAVFFMGHILVNVGMNLGLMPITGIPLPFMSYGGSHLLAEFAGLGMLSSMRRRARTTHPEDAWKEFLGA